VVKATLSALTSLRPRAEIMKLRGKKIHTPEPAAPVAA
jgi:ribosomal protein S5